MEAQTQVALAHEQVAQAPKTHRIVAHTFSEGFKIPELIQELGASPGLTDPRDFASRIQDGKGFFMFNFGSLAFWNVPPEEQQREIEAFCKRMGTAVQATPRTEDFIIEEDETAKPRVEFNKIVVDRLTAERAEVIAVTVAQSSAMEYYETLVDKIWADISQLVDTLRVRGKVAISARGLHRRIGDVVHVRNAVIGMLHLLDRPDMIWEDKTMDVLYQDLRSVFDLGERFQAMQYKLETIQDTLEVLLETFRHSRSFIVEVLILALIAFEIGLYFIEKV